MEMEKFYLTFGQESPARNGYIEVIAFDYQRARDLVFKTYGRQWSGLYTEDDFREAIDLFPAGKLGELK